MRRIKGDSSCKRNAAPGHGEEELRTKKLVPLNLSWKPEPECKGGGSTGDPPFESGGHISTDEADVTRSAVPKETGPIRGRRRRRFM